MNPLLARLYPQLALHKIPPVKQQILNSKNPNIDIKQEQKQKPIKETIKQETIQEPEKKKKGIDDELDKYVEFLEKKYQKEKTPPKERVYSKPPIPKRQTDEEQKERILKQLSKKKITKANEEIEKMKKLHEETGGDEKELKKKEAELRRGIKLIRSTRVLAKTGDLNHEEPKPEEPIEEIPED